MLKFSEMKRIFTNIKLGVANKFGVFGVASILALSSCTVDPDSPGIEFMPDMYRSPSYETYSQKFDYSDIDTNTGDVQLDARNKAYLELFKHGARRTPAKGSVARGFMPYPYPNTTEGYEAAGINLSNPIPLTEEVLAEGKAMYEIFCDHCHGEKGEGNGKIVMNENLPPIPSYLTALKDLPAGKMFHTTQYGKGNMGSHASQLSAEERWKVIHYVYELQGRNTTEETEKGDN